LARGALGIDVVVNREASRLGGEGGLRRVILQAAAGIGARVHETRTLEELEHVARGIAASGSGAVVLAGGDGSYMAGLSALARAYGSGPLPPVALAPGGTVCTVARNLGMKGSARAYARRIVRGVIDGTAHSEARPTLRVVDDSGGDRIGFIFGSGLVVRFFEAYYAAPRQGLAAAARIVGRVFAGSLAGSGYAQRLLQPTRCTLVVDGDAHAGREWSLVLASVVPDVGLHLLVPYRAGREIERFHVVASGLAPRALGSQLPRALVGRPLIGEPRIDALARSLRIDFGSEAGGYVLDGDLFRAGSANVEPGPLLSLLRV
jgi:diacylglycerol kinase family enzyme